ncbi:MAG: DUF5717 family protein [Butyrivibrio sp.]|nr:DUF5717 family protein [Acetatifactor muris]MCM1558799.1 DUF5717 family protein [Butyrivibrio sp.]
MQKLISQIMEENFDYENGSLDFSCAKIEISLNRGEVYEGSFRISAARGQFTNGSILSSDLRMECLTQEFVGCDEEILFCFHGENLEEGDVVKGNFYVISNRGEYYLPFVVSVEHRLLDSSIGAVRNLFHFANLAKSSWQEAVRLFYSPGFCSVFSGSDAQFARDYRALSVYEGSEQNMEEFLIQVNKKQKVEFLVQEEELFLDISGNAGAYAVSERELTIVRNGWGYTRLYVECIGEFLFTEKEVITDDDFLGNRCALPVFIDGNLCREGKNYGRVLLYNSFVTLSVPVTVRIGDGSPRNPQEVARKRCTVQLMELYQAFRVKKISTGTWLNETGKLVEKLAAMDENDVSARLFQAQMLITEERYNEAGWILDHVAELLEKGAGSDTLRAYYLYLSTLIHREKKYVDRVTAEVEHIYREDNGNWRVAWLLLYLSEEYHKSVTGRWIFLEKQYTAGCSSPILYIEAVALLNSNPALLRRMGSFERQVVWYGAKKDLLKAEVVGQLLYLTDKVREYSEVLYRTLEKLYEKKNDVRILQQICTLLIKGAKADSKYFEWYRLGVEHNLRITNLYEYYMMALDLDVSGGTPREIPKVVLLYFSYQNSLDYEHAAYLYNYILQNEDRLKDVYDTYRIRMEHFCMEQLGKARISRPLADIYNRLLKPEMITEQTCEPLSRLLFAHMIRVEDERLRRVYVYQPGNRYPAEYQISGGKVWVSLYGSDYTIVFEDAAKNRFIRNVEYTIEKLMLPGKFLRALAPFPIDNPEFDLYLCNSEKEGGIQSAESAARARRVAESPRMEDSVKRELMLKLLQYYYDADGVEALDEYLLKINPETLTAEERGSAIRYIVLRGNLELARQWLNAYGPYFIDVKLLVRLIGPLMEKDAMAEDAVLTASAVYAFSRGKYNSTILRYLTLYYRGMTKGLRDVWKAARSFGMDCYHLCENILIQMLYTGSFVGEKMEIFRYYVSQGAKLEVEEAFLAQCSYDYFVKERVTEKDVFDEIERMYLRGEPVKRICKLAFLKYYAENQSELTESGSRLTGSFLEELTEQRIHLEFFREYRHNDKVMQEMADKTIIEYRTDPHTRVCIHYVLLHENGESDEYCAEYMREVYAGVFFKEFILFFGENLQYYITEERGGDDQLTESGTLQKSDIRGNEAESRYHLVNDIVISKTLEDFDTMDHLLEEYYRKEFLNGRLFELK